MRRAQEGEENAYAELLVMLTAETRSYVRSRVGAPVAWVDGAVQDAHLAGESNGTALPSALERLGLFDRLRPGQSP